MNVLEFSLPELSHMSDQLNEKVLIAAWECLILSLLLKSIVFYCSVISIMKFYLGNKIKKLCRRDVFVNIFLSFCSERWQ